MWLEVLYWTDHGWSSIECEWCACGPSERLDAPSICFCMSEVISSIRTLRTCSPAMIECVVCLCLLFCSV